MTQGNFSLCLKVVNDKVDIATMPEYTVSAPRSVYQKHDSIILDALKCAKVNGAAGEV